MRDVSNLHTVNNRTVTADKIELGVLAKNDGTEAGKYGTGLYGRVIYSAGVKGIYGEDNFNESIYW